MLRNYIKPLLLMLVILTTSLHAGYDNQPVEKVEITIEGSYNKAVTDAIQSRIQTREGGFFSQSDFDNDLKTLAMEYDKIEPELKSLGGKMSVSLRLYPKPLIQEISWRGLLDNEKKEFAKELGLSIGEPLERRRLAQGLQRVQKHLIDQGYFEGTFSYDIEQEKHSDNITLIICVEKGRAGKIHKIYYDGVSKNEARCLDERIVSKRYEVLTSWFMGGGIYNEDMVQHDQFVILNFLQERGYADAQVEVEVKDACVPNRVEVIFHITRGEIYRFSEVTFSGNSLFCDEEIENSICIANGDRYNPEAIRRTVERITHLYGRKGYIDAYVQFEPKLSQTACEYTGNFLIKEGSPYCIGLIKVFGNCSTKTNVILNECLLTPGELFSLDKLELTERRLRNIGYFKNVNVYAVKREEDSCSQVRDVHIEVEEESTGKISTFFGFSNAEQFMGGFTLSEQNFNWRGIDYIAEQGFSALRGGGEFLNINLLFGAKSSKYLLSWTKPYFCDTLWSVGFQIDSTSNRYVSKVYDIDSGGFLAHANYDLNAFMRFGSHWRLRRSTVTISSDADDDLLSNDNIPSTLAHQKENDGIISAAGVSFQYDSTDSIARPSRGLRSRLDLELAGLGGDYFFAATGYKNSYYYLLFDDATVLKLRGDIKFLFPFAGTNYDKMPLDERLMLGGDTEVRGYRPYALGPTFPNKLNRSSSEPAGGLSLQYCSAELNHRIWPNLDAFVFCDAGALSKYTGVFSQVYGSVGGGIRLAIMPGNPPLTIGYGFPMNAGEDYRVQRFFINFGGRF